MLKFLTLIYEMSGVLKSHTSIRSVKVTHLNFFQVCARPVKTIIYVKKSNFKKCDFSIPRSSLNIFYCLYYYKGKWIGFCKNNSSPQIRVHVNNIYIHVYIYLLAIACWKFGHYMWLVTDLNLACNAICKEMYVFSIQCV